MKEILIIADGYDEVSQINKALPDSRIFANGEEALDYLNSLTDKKVPAVIFIDWHLEPVPSDEFDFGVTAEDFFDIVGSQRKYDACLRIVLCLGKEVNKIRRLY